VIHSQMSSDVTEQNAAAFGMPASGWTLLASAVQPTTSASSPPVPHYGLRYGFAPDTGNLQRLGGHPLLVSPLKSCMDRSFTAMTRVQ
jgi:hypothetical protein